MLLKRLAELVKAHLLLWLLPEATALLDEEPLLVAIAGPTQREIAGLQAKLDARVAWEAEQARLLREAEEAGSEAP